MYKSQSNPQSLLQSCLSPQWTLIAAELYKRQAGPYGFGNESAQNISEVYVWVPYGLKWCEKL